MQTLQISWLILYGEVRNAFKMFNDIIIRPSEQLTEIGSVELNHSRGKC